MGGYVAIPSRRYQLSGKFLYLYNVFAPFELVTIFSWPSTELRFNRNEFLRYKSLIKRLLPLRLLATLLWVLLIPVSFGSLLLYPDTRLFIFLFVSVYLVCLAIAILIVRNRKPFNLTNKDCVSLVVDVIACPPFAINVARKVFLKQEVTKTPLKLIQRVLSKQRFNYFLGNLVIKVNEFESESDLSEDQDHLLKNFKNEVKKIGRI